MGKNTKAAATSSATSVEKARKKPRKAAVPSSAVAAPLRASRAPTGQSKTTKRAPAKRQEEEEDDEDSGTESDETDDDLDLTATGADAWHGDADDDDEDDEEDEDDDGLIHVEFLFNEPRPTDFKSVRRLVERFAPIKAGPRKDRKRSMEAELFDASGMADAIGAQVHLGTMLKISDDAEDVYGFATLLPIALYKDTAWMRTIREYVMDAASNAAAVAAAFDEAGSTAALYVNERILNMPPELAPALHACVRDDLKRAAEAAPEAQRAVFAGLTQLIMLCPCWQERSGSGSVSHFYHFEEELFAAHATLDAAMAVPGVDVDTAEEEAATAGAAGKKRRRGRGDEEEGEQGAAKAEVGSDGVGARPPQTRRLIMFPVAALDACVEGMASILAQAQAAEQKEAAAAAASAPSAAASSSSAGRPAKSKGKGDGAALTTALSRSSASAAGGKKGKK